MKWLAVWRPANRWMEIKDFGFVDAETKAEAEVAAVKLFRVTESEPGILIFPDYELAPGWKFWEDE